MEAGVSSKQNFWQGWHSARFETEVREWLFGGVTFTTRV